MSNVTKPIILNETGEQIVQKLSDIAESNKSFELLLDTKADKTSVSTPYNFKGNTTYNALPTSNNKANDTYYCTDVKCKYTWNGEGWFQSSLSEVDYTDELSKLSEEIVVDNVYSFNDITNDIDLVLNSYYTKTTSGNVVNGVIRVPIEDEGYATGLFSVSEGEEYLISGTIHMEASLILEIENIDGINCVTKQICNGYSIKERITDYHYVVPEGVTNVIFQSIYAPLVVKKYEPQKINDIATTTHNNSIISDYDFEDIRDNVGVYHNYISPDGYPEDANADTTGLIYCEKGDSFKFTATAIYSTYCIGLYDSSMVLIDALYHNYSGQLYEDEIYTVTDDNVSFIRFCSYNTPLELYRGIPKAIGKKVDELSNEILGRNQNKLYGKSIAFEGDSIMQGAGSSGGYAQIIATRNNMAFQNNAIGGGTIVSGTKFASGEDKHHICETISDLPLYDYIIFNGGVNDVATAITYNTISLGEIKSGFNETLDTTIFSEALESICKVLRTKYADKKVGYIFNHRIHYEPLWVNTWKPQMIKIFEKWGVPYLDLESVVPPLNLIEDLKSTYTYNGDGWHPNLLGYNTYYVEHIENWLMSL